jgi:DNA helicase HerA-like ATPase
MARCPNMRARDVIHIGQIDFRNDNRLFGIRHEDRFSHVYVIGKTGTGKSTLIETMALQDLERGSGFALIDPHGDLVERRCRPDRRPTLPQDHRSYLERRRSLNDLQKPMRQSWPRRVNRRTRGPRRRTRRRQPSCLISRTPEGATFYGPPYT